MNLDNLGTSGKECYGAYDDTSGARGAGYTNGCIHSGANDYTANTTWYNYTIASAGTITGVSNIIAASESICPKNWTMPSNLQIESLTGSRSSSTYVASFSPVLGGTYANGKLEVVSTYAGWWGLEYGDIARRRLPVYDGSNLSNSSGVRNQGRYIRCVQSS